MMTKKRSYSRLFLNYLANLVFIRLHVRRFFPLITNYYVTKRCNLKCRYCYPPGEEPEIDTSMALTLLEKIRPHNPVLNFTGGEPLLHKDIHLLIQKAKELRFHPIILSTNGLLIDRIKDDLHLVDHLILSLDSLSEEINDHLSGTVGTTKEIIKNIKRCAFMAREKDLHISIHTVISPETINGIEEIISFCESLNITLSVSPEHGRFYPHSALKNNDEYIRLIDTLIEMKKEERPVACSFGYLKTIRDFIPHKCYPFVSPRVEPDGRVYFPCQRIKERYVFLQDYDSLFKLMKKEAEQYFFEECADRCYLACYVDVEQYIKNPFALFREYPLRQWVFGQKLY